jgi:hypothetical protein
VVAIGALENPGWLGAAGHADRLPIRVVMLEQLPVDPGEFDE